jgi:hypothetical protein
MEDKALIELMRDMLNYKKREARYLFIALIAVVVMNLLMVGAFLYFESQMETSVVTTTEQEVSGDESDIVNGDQVQGDQYNDKSQNRSGE